MKNNAIHIVLLWHSFRKGNFGVGALSIANVRLIVDACGTAGLVPKLTLIGHDGPCDYQDSIHTEVQVIAFRSFKEAASQPLRVAIKSADVVIDISEGDSFTDIYGPRRLLKQLFFKVLALTYRRPLVLAPQTIGPFDSFISRFLAAQVIRRSRLVCTRDQKSTDALVDWCPENRREEFMDVAFALPFDRPAQTPGGRLRVGLNVSALLFHQAKSGKNQFQLKSKYDELISDIVGLLKSKGAEVHLIPHVIAPHFPEDDDQQVCRSLHAAAPELILPEPFNSPIEAKSYISGLDLLIGSRMHATIAAISSGTAILPLAYSRKFTGLFDTLEYPLVADLQNEDHSAVLEKVSRALDDVETLSAAAVAAQARALRRLGAYTTRLAQLFMEVKAAQ